MFLKKSLRASLAFLFWIGLLLTSLRAATHAATRPQLPHCLSAALALYVLLAAAAQAQVIPFAGNFGQGLAPSDNQMLFGSVARLNATEPSKVGQSDSWSNPETRSHGSSTILKVFHSDCKACHPVCRPIVA